MIDAIKLDAALGQAVELEFCDGAVVQAQLLLIVLHDPQRMIYKVREVVAPVRSARSGLIVTASLAELKSWRVLAD
jgi:hypothetical protein